MSAKVVRVEAQANNEKGSTILLPPSHPTLPARFGRTVAFQPLMAAALSHETSCHPSPKKQIGTPAQLREPTRTPLLYSCPVTRSPRKTPEGAKREEGGENAVIFLWGSRATGAPLSP